MQRRCIFSLAWCLLLCACGGGSSPSAQTALSISNLELTPAYVRVDPAAGPMQVTLHASYSNAVGAISLHAQLVDIDGKVITSVDGTASAISNANGTTTSSFTLPKNVVGQYTLRVFATDQRALDSNTISGSFDVVPGAFDAPVTRLANSLLEPKRISVAGGQVYWTSEDVDSPLERVAVGGGTPSGIGKTIHVPATLAYVGSDLYWISEGGWWDGQTVLDQPGQFGSSCVHGRAIRRLFVTHPSGATEALRFLYDCVLGTGREMAHELVSDGSIFYFATTDATGENYPGATRISVNAGPGTIILSAPTPAGIVTALVARAGAVYWLDLPGNGGAGGARIYACRPTTAQCTTPLTGTFDTAVNSFAVDDHYVYYTTTNLPRTSPPYTESLLAQPIGGGAPTLLAAAIPTPKKLVAEAGVVYWIDSNSVRSVAATGGAIQQLATTANTPTDILLSGGQVFWSESTGAVHGETGAISSLPLAGGSVTLLHEGGDAPQRIAIDPLGRINWIEGGSLGQVEGFSRIARRLDSGADETVVTGFTQAGPTPYAVNGAGIFIADHFRLKRLSLDGAQLTGLATMSDEITGIVADDAYVYWQIGNGATFRVPVAGGNVATVTSDPQFGVGTLALGSDGNLYNASSTGVSRVPAAGGAVTRLSDEAFASLALDDQYLYLAKPTVIQRLPLAGGAPADFVTIDAPTQDVRIEVIGGTLFWANSNELGQAAVSDGRPRIRVLGLGVSVLQPRIAIDADAIYWSEVVDSGPYAAPPGLFRLAR